jgi:hypothetical protein
MVLQKAKPIRLPVEIGKEGEAWEQYRASGASALLE